MSMDVGTVPTSARIWQMWVFVFRWQMWGAPLACILRGY
jgi:hypothetical protein